MIGWLRRRFVLVRVHGESMSPTLRDGDRVLVGIGRPPRPGDLVVFRARDVVPQSDMRWMIKRAAAVAADGAVVVRGDNPHSQDSRHFGPVPCGSVLGVVLSGRRTRTRKQ